MNRRVAIAYTGDIAPTDRLFSRGRIEEHQESLDVVALLREADVRHGVLLTPLSNRDEPTEKIVNIRVDPSVADDLGKLHLDVFSLANNHALDYGATGLRDTMEALKARGMAYIGAGNSLREASRPYVARRHGLRVGLLAYSCLVPLGFAATDRRGGIAPIRVYSRYEVDARWSIEEPGEPETISIQTYTDSSDQGRAEAEISKLKAKVDIVCVSLHWGYGASEELATYQTPLAHSLINAGADAVLGHHVHAVQGVEIYCGKPILYSPGVFLSRQTPEDPSTLTELGRRLIAAMRPEGYVAQLEWEDGGLAAVSLVPTCHDDRGLPRLATGEAFEEVVDRVGRLSRTFDTKLKILNGKVSVKL